MEDKIRQIIKRHVSQLSDRDGMTRLFGDDRAAEEISNMFIKFIEWLVIEQEIFRGDLCDKYILNDNPYIDGKTLETIEELFNYWINQKQ